ncbi:MAG: lactonase family protein [Opitutae bacterium]
MNKKRENFMPCLLLLVSIFFHASLFGEKSILYVGTGGKNAEGIYHTVFNHSTGQFSQTSLAAKVDSPGFLALHPHQEILYTVAKWRGNAGVIGYHVSKSGTLTEFTRQPCPDGMGCHIAVHPSGHFLLTTQYGGGSVGLFLLDQAGSLSPPTIYEHSGGSGIVGNRQDSPHPHWCGYSPCGNYALIPDLGLDQIVIYHVSEDKKKISPHGKAASLPGGGPRHMRFSKDGNFIYLLNELSLSVETFSWDPDLGEAKSLFSIPTLTEQEKAEESFNSAAEILVHPTGNWVYSSNRGHDSVTFFEADRDGTLQVVQKQPIRGAFPRNINLSPDGNWLLAAGQDSHTLSAHRIDPKTGKLTFQRGAVAHVPNPICLLFLKR